MKKVLQIKKGEYLLEIRNNSVATTYKTEHALDISKWSLKQLGFIVENLRKVGYEGCNIVEIDEETNEKFTKFELGD